MEDWQPKRKRKTTHESRSLLFRQSKLDFEQRSSIQAMMGISFLINQLTLKATARIA